MRFSLESPYKPAGDQPQAIDRLVGGVEKGEMQMLCPGRGLRAQPDKKIKFFEDPRGSNFSAVRKMDHKSEEQICRSFEKYSQCLFADIAIVLLI